MSMSTDFQQATRKTKSQQTVKPTVTSKTDLGKKYIYIYTVYIFFIILHLEWFGTT